MKNNRTLIIISLAVLFVVSLALSIVLNTITEYKLTGAFGLTLYIFIKVFALFAVLIVLYLKVNNNPKTENLTFIYSTAIIQLVPLAIRIILTSVGVTTAWKIWSIVIIILTVLSFVGLYLFSEAPTKPNEQKEIE